MTAQEFCYWLNGFAELTAEPPSDEQWKAIKEHLALTFHKVTPLAPGSLPSHYTAAPHYPIGGIQVTC